MTADVAVLPVEERLRSLLDRYRVNLSNLRQLLAEACVEHEAARARLRAARASDDRSAIADAAAAFNVAQGDAIAAAADVRSCVHAIEELEVWSS